MLFYIARRIVFFIVIWFGVTLVTFSLSHVVPGDPAQLAAGPGADRSAVEEIRRSMGLDDPVHVQYFRYLGNISRLDLGVSIVSRRPVIEELGARLPASMELILVAFTGYLALGIPLAIIAATTRRASVDVVVRLFATTSFAIPSFVLAFWLQYLFFFTLDILPAGGRLSLDLVRPPTVTGLLTVDGLIAGRFDVVVDAIRHLILPATALAFGLMAIAVRVTRATLLTEMRKDYVKMARLKGLSEGAIMRRHVLRNALIPVLTLIGVQFGYLVGGTLVVETVFGWPGLGFYAFNSILNLDYAPVMGVTLVTTAVFVTTNFVIDLLYPVIDPRIRLWGAAR